MQRRSMFRNDRGITLLEMFVILILLLLVAAILFPVIARPHRGCGARKSTCQNNLKELVAALHMYWTDYDGMLPSSILHDPLKSNKWDPRMSTEFCSERGTLPPPEDLTPRGVHWVQLLYPHMKNKDIIWCPSDSDKTTGSGAKDRQTIATTCRRA